MKTTQTYYVGTHRYSYKSRERGLVTGILIIQPKNKDGSYMEPRSCFQVVYEDGSIDFPPLYDSENHILLRKEDDLDAEMKRQGKFYG